MKNTAILETWVMMILLFWSVSHCYSQGTMQTLLITFDGPPVVEPGAAVSVFQYEATGMNFGSGFGSMIRRGSDPGPEWPDNGSAYLQSSPSMGIGLTNGGIFDLVSVDYAELSIANTNATFFVSSHRQDGSLVATNFSADGIIDGTGPVADFETFVFGPEFRNLSNVSIEFPFGSLDNLVVVVPEPSVVAWLLVGGGLFASLRARRRTCSNKRGRPCAAH